VLFLKRKIFVWDSCADIDFEQGRTVLEAYEALQRLKLSRKTGRNQSLVSYKNGL
jgi:hypothetical protein